MEKKDIEARFQKAAEKMRKKLLKLKRKSDYGPFEQQSWRINGWIIVGEKENGNTVLSKGRVILEMCLN